MRSEAIKMLTFMLGSQPFSNNADWGGALVWSLSGNEFVGKFFYVGDDEICLLERKLIDDSYEDNVLREIDSVDELRATINSVR